MKKRLGFFALAALASSYFSSCNQENAATPIQTSCPANTAMITVSDGYLETLCGCAEASPAYYASGSRLLCTVTTGTTVIFHYLATHARHQVLATGTPEFPPSAVSNPEDASHMIRVHVIQLDTAGTYGFNDGYDHSLAGDIVVL